MTKQYERKAKGGNLLSAFELYQRNNDNVPGLGEMLVMSGSKPVGITFRMDTLMSQERFVQIMRSIFAA